MMVPQKTMAISLENFCKTALITSCIVSSIINLIPNQALAADNNIINPEIANISYWYSDDDIRAVLSSRLGTNAYIAPAAHNDNELIREITINAILEAETGKPVLIPVNLNNSHWVALALRRNNNGDLIVFFNDSLGGGIGGASSETGQYIAAIKELAPNAQIIDLMVHQQNDGSSCGAFTAENLIALAKLDLSSLTEEDARAVLTVITDAKAIRLLQLNGLAPLYHKIVKLEEIAQGQVGISNAETLNNVALHELSNLSSITNDRIGNLYLMDNGGFGSGVGAGDENLGYGIWIRGNIASGRYKLANDNSGISKITTRLKGVAIGADTKIDDETVIGVGCSVGQSDLKPNNAANGSALSSYSSKVQSIIGSIYGSLAIGESWLLSGNLEFGKLYAKTNYQSILNGKTSSKIKGDLMGGSVGAHYYMGSRFLTFVPTVGASYENVKFGRISNGSFNIDKTTITRFSASTGASVISNFELNNINIIPELSGSVSYVLPAKSNKIIVRDNNDVALSNKAIKSAKNVFNLGGSVTASSSMLELTFGYEKKFESKYVAGMGYAKLRINL